MSRRCCDRMYWFSTTLPYSCFIVFCYKRRNKPISITCIDCPKWFCRSPLWHLLFCFCMILFDKCKSSLVFYDIRFQTIYYILSYSICYSALRCICQRFFSIKNRFSKIRPVYILPTCFPF